MKQLNEYRHRGYTDRVDVTFDISLHEYGLIRNPKTTETIFCINPTNDFPDDDYEYEYTSNPISVEDVRDALQEAGDGYFSFVGSDLETELTNLSNEWLTTHIMSLNMYNGAFDPRN